MSREMLPIEVSPRLREAQSITRIYLEEMWELGLHAIVGVGHRHEEAPDRLQSTVSSVGTDPNLILTLAQAVRNDAFAAIEGDDAG